MLDNNLKEQLKQYLALLESPVTFQLSVDGTENAIKLENFVNEVVQLSDKLSVEKTTLDYTPSFALLSPKVPGRIVFAGVPLGHEFESFVLALLQVSGRAPKITTEQKQRIQAIKSNYALKTYVSLSCHNCPDVVQALNIIAVLNPNVSHTMIEGSMFQTEVEAKGIMAVPTVLNKDEEVTSGRQTLDQLITLLSGSQAKKPLENLPTYDILVIGGGPAGQSAAIYAARKGVKTAIVTENFGGQVNDTLGIENFIGTPYTEGPKLMNQVKDHLEQYPVDLYEGNKACQISRDDERELISLVTEDGTIFETKALIIASGAKWKNINVPGEQEFQKKGIAYCVHCDGPLFKDKVVSVVGGGNSGVEAAIDLANMAKEVNIIEFMSQLNADQVLQDKLRSYKNVNILLNTATTAILGDTKVNAISVKSRDTDEEQTLATDGVFIQVGLRATTDWLGESLERNKFGEILVNERFETKIKGVFAAGDCTNTPYKQIVIAMGQGAGAALSAFDYLVRS